VPDDQASDEITGEAPTPVEGPRPRRRSRTFGPALLLGLGGGTLAAVAGSRAWAQADGDRARSAVEGIARVGAASADASAPPVTALALVVLAAWGVVLVTRGRFRRVVTWLALAAALGATAFAVAAWVVAPGVVSDAFGQYGVSGIDVGRTPWAYAGVVGAVLAVAAGLLAVRTVRTWPEMGRRYDAPAGAAVPAATDPAEASSLELWKALDDGRDPTDPRTS